MSPPLLLLPIFKYRLHSSRNPQRVQDEFHKQHSCCLRLFSLFTRRTDDVVGVLVTADYLPDAASRRLCRSDGAPRVLVTRPVQNSLFYRHFGVAVTLRNHKYEGEERSGVKGMKGGLGRGGEGRLRNVVRPSPQDGDFLPTLNPHMKLPLSSRSRSPDDLLIRLR